MDPTDRGRKVADKTVSAFSPMAGFLKQDAKELGFINLGNILASAIKKGPSRWRKQSDSYEEFTIYDTPLCTSAQFYSRETLSCMDV